MKTKRGADVIGWLVAPLLALAALVIPLPERLVETFYSRRLYWWWQGFLTSLSNVAPFAWIDVLIVGLIVLVIWRAVRLRRTAAENGVGAAAWEAARRVVRGVAVIVLLFLAEWGFNYRRVPLDRVVNLPAEVTADELRAAVDDANVLAARLRPPPGRDIPTFDAVRDELHGPLNIALERVGRPTIEITGRPKYSLILTPFFTWAGVDGMVNPIALESIVHPDLLPFERPFAVAHEWAHLAGAADESDASAIGWLACMNGGPELAYSASLYLIVESANAMPRELWHRASLTLDAGVRADLQAMAERQAHQQPAVQRAAYRMYDEYLRANHVEGGVANYSHSLVLILSPTFREALSAYRVDRSRRP